MTKEEKKTQQQKLKSHVIKCVCERGRIPFAYRNSERSKRIVVTSRRNNCFINFNFMVSDLAVELTTIGF